MSASFCWHCSQPFPRNALEANAKYVTDQMGYPHRVHHACFDAAAASVGQPTVTLGGGTEYEAGFGHFKKIGPAA